VVAVEHIECECGSLTGPPAPQACGGLLGLAVHRAGNNLTTEPREAIALRHWNVRSRAGKWAVFVALRPMTQNLPKTVNERPSRCRFYFAVRVFYRGLGEREISIMEGMP
jgi:hypothetical protein